MRAPETEEIAERIWRDKRPANDQWNDEGLTLFNGGTTPEESLVSILDSVELHHGEYSHDPPLPVIDVLGVGVTEPIREALAAVGFTDIRTVGEGFIARRAV